METNGNATDSATTRGAVFRELHDRAGGFILPNPWDAGSARLLAGLGFEALATTSAGMAFSQGVTDGQVGWDAVLQHCRELVAATDLPVSADLERGIGDRPEDAVATVRAAADIGLAGCSLEDYSGDARQPIYDFNLAVARIRAAADAARALPHDFVLTARTENYFHGRPDLDDTIRRLRAFADAGADVLYAPGLPDLDAIRAVCAAVEKPVNVMYGMGGETYGVADLVAAGVRRISVGPAFAWAAYGAMIETARNLAASGRMVYPAPMAGYGEIGKLLAAGAPKAAALTEARGH